MNDRPKSSTFVLALKGAVPLDVFVRAVHHWTVLLDGVAREVEIESPRFALTDLRLDTPVIGAKLMDVDDSLQTAVVTRCFDIAECLRTGAMLRCTPPVRRAAEGLLRNASRDAGYPVTLTAGPNVVHIAPLQTTTTGSAFPSTTEMPGMLSGRITALSSRDTLTFTLYETFQQRAITCSLPASQREAIRTLWDSDVTVHGTIIRDAATGRPLRITNVHAIEPMRESVAPVDMVFQALGRMNGTCAPAMPVEDRLRLAREG